MATKKRMIEIEKPNKGKKTTSSNTKKKAIDIKKATKKTTSSTKKKPSVSVPVKVVKTTKPAIKKNFIFAPAIKRSDKILKIIIIPVPKSGCNIISKNTTPKTINTGIIPLKKLFISLLLLLKYLLTKIIKDNFINSLGWIPKLPIPNQLLLPFLILPIPGIKTNIKRIKQNKNIGKEYL